MGLVWTKELSVGNAIIDAEHSNLIDMINDVRHGIKARNCSAMQRAFEMLDNWLCEHFLYEEMLARAIKFPFCQHRLAQQHSLRELRHMRGELLGKGGIWSDGAANHFTQSLKNWAVNEHIIKLDMLMKPALQNYDYNFMPDYGHDEAAHNAGELQIP
ncbi:MAG: hypothetical protein A3F73_00835 [Gallionellales bacterium RIFCSPLOWO2_12_FULL_59_22]|nr:MAG: hypothetical protein A3H99_05870 [Gallionellales bacterium RIFCSPLOWO2_02_FULL_59_110]OGT02586.1 MAG: hypothetical protein A2Z65_10755 [Gallionellales bacterium RIFCSPLOWO2_02_58_13]OGT11218.1 MAG: hypothetical protein A3F73_00835 [Gallionellales bacterium RIFCSPLOWO2_12_FULL_59_22]